MTSLFDQFEQASQTTRSNNVTTELVGLIINIVEFLH